MLSLCNSVTSEYSLAGESEMEFAKLSDETEIINLYKEVIESVNLTEVRLGWNIDIYPDATFINSAISKGALFPIIAVNSSWLPDVSSRNILYTGSRFSFSSIPDNPSFIESPDKCSWV